MNERIKQLANQAGAEVKIIHGDILYISKADLDIEKFAELIVEECIDVVDVGGEFVSRPKMVERLKQHFGVEE